MMARRLGIGLALLGVLLTALGLSLQLGPCRRQTDAAPV